MWSEKPDISKVLFNTYKDAIVCEARCIFTINKHMTKETFINNNTFLGCLHSTGMVLHAHLSLPENMLLYRPLR